MRAFLYFIYLHPHFREWLHTDGRGGKSRKSFAVSKTMRNFAAH